MFHGVNELLLGVIECIFALLILHENEYLFRLNDQQKVYFVLSMHDRQAFMQIIIIRTEIIMNAPACHKLKIND